MFDKRVTLLEFKTISPIIFAWQERGTAWARPKQLHKTNYFSKVGLGAQSVLFNLHPRPLSLHNAIRWQGQHYFLTGIDRPSPVCMEVTAARVDLVDCTASRVPEGVDENKRAFRYPATFTTFPAVLTEKYQGFEQAPAMGRISRTFVLVTPKAILLRVGDLVEMEGRPPFVVQICHALDPYKNEYESRQEVDA